jgi:pyruvate-formate lyase-activating enzyme
MSTISSSVKKTDSELKTIGDLANRNRDKMSNDHKQHLQEKHNEYKDTELEKQLPKGMNRIKKPKKKIKWT